MDYIEPQNDAFKQQTIILDPNDQEILWEQVKNTAQQIQAHQFHGCGKSDCEWCGFVDGLH